MNKSIVTSALIAAVALLTACNKPAPTEPAPPAPGDNAAAAATTEPAAPAPPAPEAPTAPAATSAAPAFVGKVWQVKESSAVAPGTHYSFLVDGTLVIDAKGGTPGYGKWSYDNGALTMIEEGVSYPTDILKLDDSTFELRSHNPGEPVTITLVPAKGVPLPTAPAQ